MTTAEQSLPALTPDSLGASRYYFIKWVINRYDHEVDWPREVFEETAELFRLLVDGCLDAGVCGEAELTALHYTALVDPTPETIAGEIAKTGLDTEIKEAARERVSKDVGIVGGTSFNLTPATEAASEQLLSSFEVLRDQSTDDETADQAAEKLLGALDQVRNASTAVGSTFLFLLQPTRYIVNNSRNRGTLQALFDLDISNVIEDYFDELEKYRAVREQFGFEEHFRHMDWFCHWAAEKSSVTDWATNNAIDSRTTWQLQLPSLDSTTELSAAELWHDLHEIGRIDGSHSLGDYDDLSADNVFHTGESGRNQPTGLEELQTASAPGEIVVATDDSDIYGIGVVTDEANLAGTSCAQNIEWFVDLTRDGGPIDAARLDTDLGEELTDTDTLRELASFEELRWRVDDNADNAFTGQFTNLENYFMEQHNSEDETEDGDAGDAGASSEDDGQTNSIVTPDRSLFVQRGHDGPFRKNFGVSLTTPLTDDLRVELRWLIEDNELSGEPWDELDEMLASEYVTAWGAKPHYQHVVDEMSPDDVVLYIDQKAVRYAQPIEVVLTEGIDEAKQDGTADLA